MTTPQADPCVGHAHCPALTHVHGCFKDHGNCDDPSDHMLAFVPRTHPAAPVGHLQPAPTGKKWHATPAHPGWIELHLLDADYDTEGPFARFTGQGLWGGCLAEPAAVVALSGQLVRRHHQQVPDVPHTRDLVEAINSGDDTLRQ